jgi:ribosome-associated toxin RatA of RatAB toxin-antitoxin module
MPGVSRTIEINVPPDALFDIIVDYARYPEFLSDMASVKVVSRDGAVAQVEFDLKLMTRVSYVLKMVEERPNKVTWSLVSSGLMKSSDGGWLLEDLGGRTRATYSVDVAPKGFVPGPIVNALTGRTLPATLEAFKKRAESR